jgi:hypothetical protein
VDRHLHCSRPRSRAFEQLLGSVSRGARPPLLTGPRTTRLFPPRPSHPVGAPAAAPFFSASPVAVPLPAGFKAAELTAGRAHACARSNASQIVCWGAANKGQLGNGATTGFSAAPVTFALPAWAVPVAVAAGGDTTCLLTTNGTRLCVGDNTYNQMGVGGVGLGSNPKPLMQLLAADKVPVGPPTPPPFLTLNNGPNTCSLKLVVEMSITCEHRAGARPGCAQRRAGQIGVGVFATAGRGLRPSVCFAPNHTPDYHARPHAGPAAGSGRKMLAATWPAPAAADAPAAFIRGRKMLQAEDAPPAVDGGVDPADTTAMPEPSPAPEAAPAPQDPPAPEDPTASAALAKADAPPKPTYKGMGIWVRRLGGVVVVRAYVPACLLYACLLSPAFAQAQVGGGRRGPSRPGARDEPPIQPPIAHPTPADQPPPPPLRTQLPLASFPTAEEADAIAAAVAAGSCLDGALKGVVVGTAPAPATETQDPTVAATLAKLAAANVRPCTVYLELTDGRSAPIWDACDARRRFCG